MNETQPSAAAPLAEVYTLAKLIGPLAADVDRRRAALAAGRQLGPITKLPKLDSLLGNVLEVGVHTLHGAPAVGKSAMALGIAADCGVPALFVSCELGGVEVMRRLIARTTGTYLNKFKNGSLTGARVQDLAEKTAAALPMLGIMDASSANAPLEHIIAALTTLRECPAADQALGDGALVVVDSLHTWAARVWHDREEYERLSLALAELELLAQSLSIPVFLIAERNRASMKSGGQSGGAGNRRIEYSGETVIELDKAREGDEEDAEGYIDVILTVSKNRHGKTGKVPLRWHGATQKHTAQEEG